FNFNNTPGPTVTNVPTQTIASLQLVNGVSVTMSTSGANTLTISSGTASALSIPVANTLNIQGANALKIALTSGSTGSISGVMILQDGAHQLTATGGSTATFNSSAIFTTASTYSSGTNPFGTGIGGNGSNNSIIFASGSAYFHNAGGSPFGSVGAGPVVVFQTGSEADILNATNFQANGRTYANLVIGKADPGGIAVNASDSGTGSFQFDNLTIKSTASASSSLTYAGSGTSAITIQGNITSNGAGNTGTLPDVTLTAGSGGISINKPSNTVTFGNDGSNTRSVNLDGNVTVTANTTLALNRIVQLGMSNPNSKTVTVNGALTGGASGYVIGSVLKNFSGGSNTFQVGTAN